MRHIVRTVTIEDFELIAGEWEAVEYVDKTVVDECGTLEEALERLAVFNLNRVDNEVYHIGYDDVNLYLEEWEEEWIRVCEIEDRLERELAVQERRDLGVPDVVDTDEEYNYEYLEDIDEFESEQYGYYED